MPSADYYVNVYWEAVPYSDTYYLLSDQDKAQVNAILVNAVNALVPLQQQKNWRNLYFPNRSYDDILVQINSMLMAQVVPPPGKVLVLAAPQAVYWKPTSLGHQIIYFANLADSPGGTAAAWEIPATYNNVTHRARMGLAYECILA